MAAAGGSKRKEDPWADMENGANVAFRDLSDLKGQLGKLLAEQAAAAAPAAGADASVAVAASAAVKWPAGKAGTAADSLLDRLLVLVDKVVNDHHTLALVAQHMSEHPEKFSSTPASEIQRREDYVHDLKRKLDRSRGEIAEWERRRDRSRRAASSAAGGAAAAGPELTPDEIAANEARNDYVAREMQYQTEVRVNQDAALGRIHAGLESATEKAKRINEELEAENERLKRIDDDMTKVQVKMDGAAKRVGKMLDEANDKTKIIIIAVLLVILIALVLFTFSGSSS